MAKNHSFYKSSITQRIQKHHFIQELNTWLPLWVIELFTQPICSKWVIWVRITTWWEVQINFRKVILVDCSLHWTSSKNGSPVLFTTTCNSDILTSLKHIIKVICRQIYLFIYIIFIVIFDLNWYCWLKYCCDLFSGMLTPELLQESFVQKDSLQKSIIKSRYYGILTTLLPFESEYTFTFTFNHLAEAFIQSDVQMRRTIEAIRPSREQQYIEHIWETTSFIDSRHKRFQTIQSDLVKGSTCSPKRTYSKE